MTAEGDAVLEICAEFFCVELLFLRGDILEFLFLCYRIFCGLFASVEFDRAVKDSDMSRCAMLDLLVVMSYDDEELIL